MAVTSRSQKRRTVVPRRNVTVLPVDRVRDAQPAGRLTIDGRRLDMAIGDRLTGAKLARTIAGASTLTIDVWDGDRTILKSGGLGLRVLSKVSKVKLDGVTYNVAGLSRSAPTLTLTCEEWIVVQLKRDGKSKPVRVARSKITRAGFCAKLIRDAGYPVIVLDEQTTQTIAGQKDLKKTLKQAKNVAAGKAKTSRSSKRGLAGSITVKDKPADAEQRRVLAKVLETAASVKGATGRSLITLVATVIVECEARNVQGSGANTISLGVIQAIPGRTAGPKGTFTRAQALDIAYSVRAALLPPGPTSNGGGLVNAARKYPNDSIGLLADRVINGLGVGDPQYVSKVNGRRQEAEQIITAYDAGMLDGSGSGGSTSTTRTKTYTFERKRGESTWTACRRLLDEVGWRLFVREGVIVIASDPALMRAKASLVLDENTEHWDPDFDMHRALAVSEMSGQIAATRYQADPGEVIQVSDLPQTEDRWLLATSEVDLLDDTAPVEIHLQRPQDPAKEPAPETVTVTNPTSSTAGSAAAPGDGSLRSRIVRAAQSSLTSKTGYLHYSMKLPPTENDKLMPSRNARSDCSQWTHACYRAAGAPSPGLTTWEQAAKGRRTSRPQPGDLMLTRDTGHVELYCGGLGPPGKNTIGHGTRPIDYANTSAFPGHYFVTFDFLDKD